VAAADGAEVFGVGPFLASCALLALSPFLFDPLRLAWIDARLCNSYRFEAIGSDGTRHAIAPAAFALYTELFVVGKFRYLSDEKLLVNTWAETQDRALATAIRAAADSQALEALARRDGKNHFNEARAAAMDRFIRAVIGAASDRGVFGASIDRVNIRQIKIWYDGNELREIEDKVIREVALSAEEKV
jgi:hypothetical protein